MLPLQALGSGGAPLRSQVDAFGSLFSVFWNQFGAPLPGGLVLTRLNPIKTAVANRRKRK
jgi:hypothetical protein